MKIMLPNQPFVILANYCSSFAMYVDFIFFYFLANYIYLCCLLSAVVFAR